MSMGYCINGRQTRNLLILFSNRIKDREKCPGTSFFIIIKSRFNALIRVIYLIRLLRIDSA